MRFGPNNLERRSNRKKTHLVLISRRTASSSRHLDVTHRKVTRKIENTCYKKTRAQSQLQLMPRWRIQRAMSLSGRRVRASDRCVRNERKHKQRSTAVIVIPHRTDICCTVQGGSSAATTSRNVRKTSGNPINIQNNHCKQK